MAKRHIIGFLTLTRAAMLVGAMSPVVPARAAALVSAEVARLLVEGQQAFNAGDFVTALARAFEADAIPNKRPYEVYQVAKLMALTYVKQNALDTAAVQFNRAIASG